MGRKDPPHCQTLLFAAVPALLLGSISFAVLLMHRDKLNECEAAIAESEKKRQEERTGRIRAEVRLRVALKQQRGSAGKTQSEMVMQRIGVVTSPYAKRMGTPRQPQLVPASRGWIDLEPSLQPALLDGIETYSHIWVIFEFHANTDTASTNKKTKIRPPRANGLRVGQLATRSPHRPNPLGLSMVAVEKLENRRLHVSGLDLVHGTPVYDIKPVVPWDIPGSTKVSVPALRVPNWVSQDDAIASVEFTVPSLLQLRDAVSRGYLKPLYTDNNSGFEGALETLRQILAQDPRSSHRGLSSNARGQKSEGKPYSLVFGSATVTFSFGDGAVQVLGVEPANFNPENYADGIPLVLTSAEQ